MTMSRVFLVMGCLYGMIAAVSLCAQEVELLKAGVVRITSRAEGESPRTGTGFIVHLSPETAYIVTSEHVIAGDKHPNVEFFTRRHLPVSATVVAVHRDVALLLVEGKNDLPSGLIALPLATAVDLKGGEEVTVIGFPAGAGLWSVIKGSFVSQKGLNIQFSGDIDAGNSGSPMIRAGQVLGVVQQKDSQYGRATPATIVREALKGEVKFASSGLIVGRDGKEMVLVPAGWFEMGSTEEEVEAAYELAQQYSSEVEKAWYEPETPRHWVWLDAFFIDKYKVTMAEHRVFVRERETKRRDLPEWTSQYARSERHPVIGVSWEDVEAYCRWAEKRLPTEAQWEKAARGTDGRGYPWGIGPVDGKRANYCDANCEFSWRDKNQSDSYRYSSPVDAYELGKSPYGIFDLAGNVWEWVRDWYDGEYYSKSPERNPVNETEAQYRVVRGGSWDSDPSFLRTAYRGWREPESRTHFVGFRCVLLVASPDP
jgi:formylglycine-generating enzyme required for sulfatase activity